MKLLRNLAIFTILLSPFTVYAETYKIESAHSSIQFSVRHLGISNVKGNFHKFEGTIEYDPAKPEETKVVAEIDTNSIDTANSDRDKHVKSKDFLEVVKFPNIKFVSTQAKSNGEGSLLITGDLTILGFTKPITLLVEDIVGPVLNPMDKKTHIGASATAKLVRQDYGVTWTGKGLTGVAGEATIGDEIKLNFEIDGVKE